MSKIIILLFIIAVSCITLPPSAEAERIDDCLDISSNFSPFENGKQVTEAVVLKAKQKAVRILLKKEMEKIGYNLSSDEKTVNALIPLLEINKDTIKETSTIPFNICVSLEATVSANNMKMLEPLMIGRFCTHREGLTSEFIEKTKITFVNELKGKIEKSIDNKSKVDPVISTLINRSGLSSKPDGILLKYFHIEKDREGYETFQSVKCKNLFIYPVEFLAEANKK